MNTTVRKGITIELHHSFFSPVSSGQERRMHYLAGELADRGIAVRVVTSRPGVDNAEQFNARGIQVVTHPGYFTRMPLSLMGPLVYAKRLEQFLVHRPEPAPDLVIGFNYAYVLAAKRAWQRTQVWFLPGGITWDWLKTLYCPQGSGFLGFARLFAKYVTSWPVEYGAILAADQVFVESHYLQKRMSRFYPAVHGKIDVLSAPIDLARFHHSPELGAKTRRALGISRNTCVILAVGRLDWQKNYATVLSALSNLQTQSWVFLIAGEGPSAAELQRLCLKLGIRSKVLFLGKRKDPEALYNAADIYVQPSLLESYSNTVQEAIAVGVPSIISRSINRDLTDHQNVLLADPNNIGEWSEMIQSLLDNPGLRLSLHTAALRFSQTRPSWSDLADWILERYESSIQKHALS